MLLQSSFVFDTLIFCQTKGDAWKGLLTDKTYFGFPFNVPWSALTEASLITFGSEELNELKG